MSGGGWASLRKRQQEMSTQSPPYQPQYEISPKDKEQQEQLVTIGGLPHAHIGPDTLTPTQGPITPSENQLVQLPVNQENCIRASRFLRILHHWRALAAKSRLRHPPARSSSFACSRLNLVLPLSCISSSNLSSLSDSEADEDVYAVYENESDIPLDLGSKTANCSASPLLRSPYHISTESPQPNAANLQWSGRPLGVKINSNYQAGRGQERELFSYEEKTRPAAGCVPSSPKLRYSLSLPVFGKSKQEVDEELESLQPSKEDAATSTSDGSNNTMLRKTSSSPLRRSSLVSSKLSTIPKGYLALYVGKERKRFLVKANLVNHPMFSVLLEKAKEEFGFDQKGGLNIPCDIAFFQHIMFLVESNQKAI